MNREGVPLQDRRWASRWAMAREVPAPVTSTCPSQLSNRETTSARLSSNCAASALTASASRRTISFALAIPCL